MWLGVCVSMMVHNQSTNSPILASLVQQRRQVGLCGGVCLGGRLREHDGAYPKHQQPHPFKPSATEAAGGLVGGVCVFGRLREHDGAHPKHQQPPSWRASCNTGSSVCVCLCVFVCS